MSCVFCSIISGVIPVKKLYEDDKFVIFPDIEPKAEKHYLAVPKAHYSVLEDMTAEDKNNLGDILLKISKLKKDLGLEGGYRLIINQGKDAGQSVFHLHIHILGGQELEFADLKKA